MLDKIKKFFSKILHPFMKIKIPEFNEKDFERIHTYLGEWDKWRREKKIGLPDYTRDTIHLLPLTIALLKSEFLLSKLTLILIILTSVLAIETMILIFN